MPTVLRVGSLIFFFYSNEGQEPPHIHIRKGAKRSDAIAKWWLSPPAKAYSHGFTVAESRTIESTVRTRRKELLDAWRKHFEAP